MMEVLISGGDKGDKGDDDGSDGRMMMTEGWELYDGASGFRWDDGDVSLDGTVMAAEAAWMTVGWLFASVESCQQRRCDSLSV